MNAAVGSFTKSTGAAPANQVAVSGLSFTPTVVFLWTTGNNTAQDSWAVSSKFTFGFATASAGRSVSHAAQDAQGFSNATRNFQNKALSVVQWGEVISAECDLTITSDGFELNWTTNNAVAFHINYLAIDPANASIVDWDHATTGDKSVAGAGFVPEMVMHLTAWAQAHPNTGVDAFMCLGAMTATNQWTLNVGDADNQNSTINTQCVVTDGCLVRQNLTSMALDYRASYVSMDSDGFTVNWTGLNTQRFFSSLCMAGGDFSVGTEVKSTGAATAVDVVTDPGFEPVAVLLGINGNVTAAGTGVQHARFGIGASDGTNERAAVNSSQDNIGTSTVDSYMASAKAIVKNNNSTQTIDAQADLAMTSSGFDLSWTTNDAVATLVPWIAFGPLSVGGGEEKTGTDEQAFGSTETATLSATLPSNDSQAFGVTESGVVTVNQTATDSQAIGSSETAVRSVTTTATDEQAFGSSESEVRSVIQSQTDSQAFGVTESALVSVTQTQSDSQAIGTIESPALSVTHGATDSQSIGVTESASLVVPSAATDDQAFGITESAELSVEVAGTDSQAFGVSESASLSVTQAATDSQAFGVSESEALSATLGATDAQAFGSDESGIIGVPVFATDEQAFGVDESAIVIVSFPVSDLQAFGIDESVSFSVTFFATDDQSFDTDEVGFLSQTLAATDTQAFSTDELTAIVAILTASDQQGFSVTETWSRLQQAIGPRITGMARIIDAITGRPSIVLAITGEQSVQDRITGTVSALEE